MKIWTITTDQDGEGTATAVHVTESAARAQFARIVAASWESWFGTNAAPMPDDTAKAWEVLTMQTGFIDTVSLAEHDISDHPAIAAAIEATALAETVIGKLAKGDLNLHTEQGEIMDAYDAVADANCLLLGKMAADEITIGLSPNLQAEDDRQCAAYIAAARAHATDDLEFDDHPAVSMGDDEGAFVSCWKWITAAEAGLVEDAA